MPTIIKHSYLKGSTGYRKAVRHVDYLQYRTREDRCYGPRLFFSKDEDAVSGGIVKKKLGEQSTRRVVVHKVVVSPGIKSANIKAFVTEIMDKFARSTGQAIEWFAVEHRNTPHPHAHVLVMGTALDDSKVGLYLEDTRNLRQWGDLYLEREHVKEKFIEKELTCGSRSADIDRFIRDPSPKKYPPHPNPFDQSPRISKEPSPQVLPHKADFSQLDVLLGQTEPSEKTLPAKISKDASPSRTTQEARRLPTKKLYPEKEPERER